MSQSDKLEDIAKMAENMNLTSSQEDKLLGMETEGESVSEVMEVTVVDNLTPHVGLTKADTPGVLTEVNLITVTEGEGETSNEPASTEGQGASGEKPEPEGLSKRAMNRRRQKLTRAKKREKEKAMAISEHLLPLNTPKRAREVEDTPPSGGRGAKKVTARGSDLGDARKDPQGPLSAPKPSVTVPVAQSTPSKTVQSAPKPMVMVPGQNESIDSRMSAPEPSALVPPNESMDTTVDATPISESVSSGTTRAEGGVAPKVPRIPKRPREKNSTSEQGPSYAKKAAEDLDMAIVDMRDGNQLAVMSDDRFKKLQAAISNLLIAQTQKTKTAPCFEENRLVSGVMRLKCASSFSRHWLERNVPKIAPDQLWPGVNLSVIGFDNIPKPIKCNVFLPCIQAHTRGIFSLLEASNQGVNTGGWSVMHRENRNGGTFMQLGIDRASRDVLKVHGYKLFCGLGGKATFNLKGSEATEPKPAPPKGPNKNPRAKKNKGATPILLLSKLSGRGDPTYI